MIGGAADALLAKWTKIANTQLQPGSPFSSACEQRRSKGIRFNVRILTPGEQHELSELEPALTRFLSHFGFDVAVEHGVHFTHSLGSDFDDTDLLIVFPLSNDVENFCVHFAMEQSSTRVR
jgi:hypothetical protein